jgi:RHS repeat-associated protein
VAGRTVGLLLNGVFTPVPTDARGTVLADTDGTARFASPFGWRDVYPTMSAAIDYVEKGFDPDLGLVRMGVRDYDPEINRFTTADPLVIGTPEICLENNVACNLYGYARAQPTRFVDPDGRLEYDPTQTSFRIERGDTLTSVSKETGISAARLLAANPGITHPDRIQAGDPIGIPDTTNIKAFKWAVGQIGNAAYGVAAKNDGFAGADPSTNFPGTNKCNLFSAHAYEKGAGVAFPRHDTLFGLLDRNGPATAGELATERFSGTELVGLDRARIGDVIAWKKNFIDATGHAAIFTGQVNIVGAPRPAGEFGTVGASADMVRYRTQGYLESHDYKTSEAAIRRIGP